MVNLYKNKTTYYRPPSRPSNWKNIELGIQQDFLNYIQYMHNSNGRTSPTNLIVRLIEYFNDSPDLEFFDYAHSIFGKSDNATLYFDFVDSFSKGKIHDNVFGNNEEVVILSVEDGIPDVSNWQDLEPIRFVYHSERNLRFSNLYEEKVSNSKIYLELDILMLMLMYRSWIQYNKSINVGSDIENFVYSYVMPNMFKSYFNIGCVNIFFESDESKIRRNGIKGLLVNDNTNSVTKSYVGYRNYLRSRSEKYGYYLESIPTFESNALSTLRMTYSINTKLVNVFATISRLHIFDLMVAMFGDNVKRLNNDILNDVWFTLRTIVPNTINASQYVTSKEKNLIELYFSMGKGV